MNRFKENFNGNFSAKKNKIVIQIENSKSCKFSNARLNCIIHDLSDYLPLNGQFWKLKINKSLKIWLYRDFKYLKLNNLRTRVFDFNEDHGTRYIEKWTREILKTSQLDKENLSNFYGAYVFTPPYDRRLFIFGRRIKDFWFTIGIVAIIYWKGTGNRFRLSNQNCILIFWNFGFTLYWSP